jgi:hypothetical protein
MQKKRQQTNDDRSPGMATKTPVSSINSAFATLTDFPRAVRPYLEVSKYSPSLLDKPLRAHHQTSILKFEFFPRSI